ncbi:MAG: response regulator transcription factor [Thermoguttaceae bacterium]
MKGKHILVVEDESHLAAGIKYNLVAEGYRVTTVGDGPSALEYIKSHPESVDLIILDLMLPGMSGYAVCESLRSDFHHMPILILSARTLSEDRARGFDVGADQYLTKPFDLDELLSRVKGLLTLYSRRVGQQVSVPRRAQVFRFADSEVDFEAFQATVRGKAVRMTQLEMKLLRYFAENDGRLIPRHELLEHVWEMPGHLSTRAPDQFIRRLRKIFEPDPASPRHFLTIRDVGYRFVAKGEDS